MLPDSPSEEGDLEEDEPWELPAGAKARRRTLRLEEQRSTAIQDVDCRNALDFYLAEGRGGAVVDLGCGDGFFARRFARSGRFGHVYGLDVSYDELETCRSIAQLEGIRPNELNLVQGDVEAMPFADGQMEFVMFSMLMHLLPDIRPALKEIFRILRPGLGRLYAATYVEMPGIRSAKDLKQILADEGFGSISVRLANSGVRYVVQAVREA